MEFTKFKHHESWDAFCNDKENITELDIINGILFCKMLYPDYPNILRFQNQDLKAAKCVILGMEPYPSSYVDEDGLTHPVATGRSFEVANIDDWTDKYPQASLKNILKTIYYNEAGEIADIETVRNKIKSGEFNILPPHDWFDNLEEQGVIFLNATLTVQPGVVGSHKKLWDVYMTNVIRYMVDQNHGLKWMIWGKDAMDRVHCIVPEENIICSCHPRMVGFVNMNCFQYEKRIAWTGADYV